MALKTIDDLILAGAVAADDLIEIWRTANGDTRKVTKSIFLDGLDTEVIAARTAIPYLAGSPLAELGDALAVANRNVKHVEAYGAVGDGLTDDTVAINAALAAAVAGDTIAFAAGKTYRAPTTLTIDQPSITLLGYGATIDSSELDNDTGTGGNSPVSDVNPAIYASSVDDLSIIGLTIIGPNITGSLNTLVETGNSTGIFLSNCDNCKVKDCRIEGFFRGAITVTLGDNAIISGNHVDRNRYREPEFGSIFLTASKNSSVVGNVITGVWGSGVSAQNSTRCTITGNTIQGATDSETQSMGIACYNCSHMTVTANTIDRITDEGIVFTTGGGTGTACNYNVIANNIMQNCHLYGVCLRVVGGSSGDIHYANYNVVSGNTVIADEDILNGEDMLNAYFVETDFDGTGFDHAVGNLFIGNSAVATDVAILKGFSAISGANVSKTSVIGNTFSGCSTGIHIIGNDSLVANNHCDGGNRGIIVANSSPGTLVQGNVLVNSAINGIQIPTGSDNARTQIVNNMMDTAIDNDSTASGLWIANNARSDLNTTGTFTLTGGQATITASVLATGESEAGVMLIRKTQASTPSNTGALSIGGINQASNQVTVKSNNASDDGTGWWFLVR